MQIILICGHDELRLGAAGSSIHCMEDYLLELHKLLQCIKGFMLRHAGAVQVAGFASRLQQSFTLSSFPN